MCGATHCWADLETSYEGYSGFLTPGNSLETGKYYNTSNQIRLDRAPGPVEDRKIVCELWSAYFGRDAMSETASASCTAVGR